MPTVGLAHQSCIRSFGQWTKLVGVMVSSKHQSSTSTPLVGLVPVLFLPCNRHGTITFTEQLRHLTHTILHELRTEVIHNSGKAEGNI